MPFLGGKTVFSIRNQKRNYARHTKNKPQEHQNLKKQTQTTPFCHVQKQLTIFHKFSFFFNIQFL